MKWQYRKRIRWSLCKIVMVILWFVVKRVKHLPNHKLCLQQWFTTLTKCQTLQPITTHLTPLIHPSFSRFIKTKWRQESRTTRVHLKNRRNLLIVQYVLVLSSLQRFYHVYTFSVLNVYKNSSVIAMGKRTYSVQNAPKVSKYRNHIQSTLYHHRYTIEG